MGRKIRLGELGDKLYVKDRNVIKFFYRNDALLKKDVLIRRIEVMEREQVEELRKRLWTEVGGFEGITLKLVGGAENSVTALILKYEIPYQAHVKASFLEQKCFIFLIVKIEIAIARLKSPKQGMRIGETSLRNVS